MEAGINPLHHPIEQVEEKDFCGDPVGAFHLEVSHGRAVALALKSMACFRLMLFNLHPDFHSCCCSIGRVVAQSVGSGVGCMRSVRLANPEHRLDGDCLSTS